VARRLATQEAAEIAAVRRTAELPAPGSDLTPLPPEEVHGAPREGMRVAATNANRQGATAPQSDRLPYLATLRSRREALRKAVDTDLLAAAAVAARRRGWVLAVGTGEDATAELAGAVRDSLKGTGLGAKR
jgi:hypothetical protein